MVGDGLKGDGALESGRAKVLGCRGGGRVGQEPVNLPGDGAFEATEGFLGAFAFPGSGGPSGRSA